MPAISSREVQAGVHALQIREWRNTVGQSGMTPTAFAFLIPVFVVAVATPFLCAFCIRKRRQAQPIIPVSKKPALRRAEARARLESVTEISNVTKDLRPLHTGSNEVKERVTETRSFLEKECAICLSTLHAPSPPEPAKLSEVPVTDEAAKPLSTNDLATHEPESILRLHVCGHEFHAECLVSWFVLRKTSCPICRAEYYTKEAMQLHDEEAQLVTPQLPQEMPLAPVAQLKYNRQWGRLTHVGVIFGLNAVKMHYNGDETTSTVTLHLAIWRLNGYGTIRPESPQHHQSFDNIIELSLKPPGLVMRYSNLLCYSVDSALTWCNVMDLTISTTPRLHRFP
ncbi:Nn.00g004870.m01.CDS01 [Neocucurbitaria sp. VM-36]